MEAWTTEWAVSVDGRDLTSRMNPYLQSIEVTDKDGTASDTCSLALDDSKGQVKLPRAGGAISVSLDGVQVFRGTIDEINSTGGRSPGMLLTISAKGFDSRGPVKAPLDFHLDDATLQQFLDAAARRAGIDRVIVDPVYGDTRRDYWSADNESFVHLVERLAREYGGSFKIQNERAILMQRGAGVTPSGKPIPDLTVTRGPGGNLLTWDISPFVGRHRGTKAKVKFYDRKTGRHETREAEIDTDGDGVPDATLGASFSAADADGADLVAKGKKSDSQRKSGEGSVTVILMPEVRVDGMLVVQGVRPGIDGAYRVSSVSHRLDRSSGGVTTIELKQPGKGTGAKGDTRKTGLEEEVDRYAIANAPANQGPGGSGQG